MLCCIKKSEIKIFILHDFVYIQSFILKNKPNSIVVKVRMCLSLGRLDIENEQERFWNTS